MRHKLSHSHKERFDQSKIDRLAHIDSIYDRTVSWSIQLMNLYEERKRLRLIVSRMEKPNDKISSNGRSHHPIRYTTGAREVRP